MPSAFGTAVEMVAQGENITLVGWMDGHATISMSGTSFATPQVTSLAAILASIDPTLSATEIRQRIFAGSTSGPSSTAARALNIARPIHQLLLDSGGSFAEELDFDADGLSDRPGAVVTRLCGGSTYEVDGYGSYSYEGGSLSFSEDGVVVTGNILESGFGLTLQRQGSDALSIACEGCPFALGPQPISSDGPLIVSFSRELAPSAGGEGISGTWNVTECAILERFPDILSTDDTPMTVQLTSSLVGQLEASDVTLEEPVVVGIRGELEVPAIVEPLPPEHPIIQTLESECTGGRNR